MGNELWKDPIPSDIESVGVGGVNASRKAFSASPSEFPIEGLDPRPGARNAF